MRGHSQGLLGACGMRICYLVGIFYCNLHIGCCAAAYILQQHDACMFAVLFVRDFHTYNVTPENYKFNMVFITQSIMPGY
jgi:hypothetical protein